jgi:hypothetical protein
MLELLSLSPIAFLCFYEIVTFEMLCLAMAASSGSSFVGSDIIATEVLLMLILFFYLI